MEKKTIIMLIACIVIIICLVFAGSNNKFEIDEIKNESINKNLNYKPIIDNDTGDTYYQIYNEDNGDVIANVIEEKDIQIYLDNPEYQGKEEDSAYESYMDENAEVE